ncbi:MAG: hypothetical protein ACR2NZ_20335, partial [Rubripirellula sp.]
MRTVRFTLHQTLFVTVVTLAFFASNQLTLAQSLYGEDPDPTLYGGSNYEGSFCDASCCDEMGNCEIPIEKYRKTFCQGAEILGGYLFDTGDQNGGMDQTFEEVRANFGLPLGSMDNLLGFRPYFRADHLKGPSTIDVPGTVYNTGLNILHQKKWSEKCSTTLVFTPSIRSDFKTSDEAFRVFGLALWNWQCRDDLALSLGVVYFDRADFNFLPAFGAVWTPSPTWKFDGTMPRPRIFHRLWKDGGNAEGWAYIGGKIGGNTWGVRRDSGMTDELTIRDFRLLGGYEVLRPGNRGFFVEGGFAFGRT